MSAQGLDHASDGAATEEVAESSAKHGDPVTEKIEFTGASQNPFLNISQLKLNVVPEALLNLTHLQFLYAAFNGLKELPDDFFSALANVKWLDLRGNRLRSLPTLDLNCHAFLEYLLIEDNCISHLPLELGYVHSLRGIALSGNPLDFPHAEVAAAGTASIKAYLREVGDGRREIEHRLASERRRGDGVGEGEDVDNGSGSVGSGAASDDEDVEEEAAVAGAGPSQDESDRRFSREFEPPPLPQHQHRQQQQQPMLTANPAQLHKPAAPQIRQRASGGGGGGGGGRMAARQSDRHRQLVHRFPEPPPPGQAERRAVEERRNARRQETLARQEAVLQRRRDAEASRQWREEARKLQMERAHEQLVKGPLAAARESHGRIQGAPFNAGWDSELMELPSQADVDRRRWQGGGVRPDPRPEPLSAEAQVQLERQLRAREADIAERVQQHTAALMERRQMLGGAQAQQKVTPSQAVEAARRDVEIAMEMQRELALRRAQLENRTLAFQPGPAASSLTSGGAGSRGGRSMQQQQQPGRK